VNDFWMCDIGRFNYHWTDGPERLRYPLELGDDGSQQPGAWKDVLARIGSRAAAGSITDRLTFLVSAHASLEEMYLVQRLASGLKRSTGADAISVTWSTSPKPQPAATRFRIPEVDAPNVRGARDLGLLGAHATDVSPDLSSLRSAIRAGSVRALYVVDGGPPGSLGDVSWVAAARRTATLPLLIVQGAATTELSLAADFVLPGGCAYEKSALYTNDKGRVQITAPAIPEPGDAMPDWQILVDVAHALGADLPYTDLGQVRSDLARTLERRPGYANLTAVTERKPASVETWLQASNPSERWKWDRQFRDLPPLKFGPDTGRTDPVT